MVQRLRITFARVDETSYLSHLELMRLWERAFRRAGWRLAHSQGFNPHPRLSFAAALPVGVAGEAELLDVYLEIPRPPSDAIRELAERMPGGIQVRQVEEVPVDAPAIQRSMVAAEYRAICPEGLSLGELETAAARLLAAAALPRERAREGRARSYDLRPLIRSLAVVRDPSGRPLVWMELRCDAQGAGRPDELLREMGLEPADCRVIRTRLLMGP